MTAMYALPSALVFVLVVAAFVGLACGGHILVHRAFADYDFISHNEVAGFIYAIIGVLYAVLLGFVVVVVWEQYNGSDERDRSEVAAVAAAWRLATGLPALTETAVRGDLSAYVNALVRSEWPAMEHGGNSPEAKAALDAAIRAVVRAPSGADQATRGAVLAQLSEVSADRSHRLQANVTGIPPLLWAALVFGGLLTIGFAYIFGLPNFRVQLLMTAALAAIIAALFVVIAELDYPFRGDTGITAEPWTALNAELRGNP